MQKEETKKDFSYIWDLIEFPVVILVLYSLLDLAFSITDYIGKIFPAAIFGFLLTVFAFGLVGYNTINRKESPSRAARYGAYAGIIVGLAGAVIGIITFYFFPEKIAEAIQKAIQAGADASTAKSIMKIGIYTSLLISPAIDAGIGALISWISASIFKKKK